MLEEVEWIGWKLFNMFYGKNDVKKERLASAIDKGIINFKIKRNNAPVVINKLLYSYQKSLDNPVEIREHTEHDDMRKGVINCYLDKFLPYTWSLKFYLEAKSFRSWLKDNYLLKKTGRMYPDEQSEYPVEKTSELSLLEILNLITPKMYPDGLKRQEKSAITKSVNTLKDQLPEAFELCCSLVMEAMPCEDREEYLKYTRDDIINAAQKRGIKRPIALQIHKGIPAVMKK
jgi:hypothetical protein